MTLKSVRVQFSLRVGGVSDSAAVAAETRLYNHILELKKGRRTDLGDWVMRACLSYLRQTESVEQGDGAAFIPTPVGLGEGTLPESATHIPEPESQLVSRPDPSLGDQADVATGGESHPGATASDSAGESISSVSAFEQTLKPESALKPVPANEGQQQPSRSSLKGLMRGMMN